jgi:ribonucleoside-diphosphate reductase alpha chain
MVGGAAFVIGSDGKPHFVNRIFPTGTKPVYRLRTRSGYELRVTADHRVLTEERGDVAAKDLRVGERMRLAGSGFGSRRIDESVSFAIGVAVGDGCVTRLSDGSRQVVLTMAPDEAPVLEDVAVALNIFKRTTAADWDAFDHR